MRKCGTDPVLDSINSADAAPKEASASATSISKQVSTTQVITRAPLHAVQTSIARWGGPGNGNGERSPASPGRPRARLGIEQSPPAPPTTPAVAAHAVRPIASLFRSPVRLRSWQQPNTTGHALANIALHRGMHPRWPERSRGSSGLAGRTRGRRGPPWWSCAPCPSRQPGPSSASSPPPAGRAGAGRAPSPTRGSSRHRPAGELSADDQQAGDEALDPRPWWP